VSIRAPFYTDIQTRYPDVTVIPVDSVVQGLEKVQQGEVFGLVDTAPAIGHYIQENNLFDLKISGELPYQVRFQANKKLEAISYLDGLTGIPNRRKFDDVLETEWKRCERNQLTLTLRKTAGTNTGWRHCNSSGANR
jgi:hypothetical protein